MRREIFIDKQISISENITLNKELFPKLNAHYEDLNEDNAKDCIFKGVALLPGWIVKLDDE